MTTANLQSIDPMLPTLVQRPFSNPAWLFEPKWDGYRAICYIEGGRASFISRRRNDLSKKFPTLQTIPSLIKSDAAILDGEIVAIDAAGNPRFDSLRTNAPDRAIVFYAFDLLHVDGRDITQQRLIDRKRALKRLLPRRNTAAVRYTEHIIGAGEELFRELEKAKLEGMVAKLIESTYVSGRSRAWLKVKTRAGRAEMQKRSEAWHG